MNMTPQEIKDQNRKKLEAKRNQLTAGSDSVKNINALIKSMTELSKDIQDVGIKDVASSIKAVSDNLAQVTSAIQEADREDIAELTESVKGIVESFNSIEIKPRITTPKPEVNIDMKSVVSAVKELDKSITSIDIPKQESNKSLLDAMNAVKIAVNSIRFPVPNYVLPYKDTDGKATQVTLDSSGRLPTTATIETGDIEIGAVEIKNATDDTRATVGANGLYVDVQASALPTGASTAANQQTDALTDTELRATPVPTTINNKLVPELHDEIQATYPTTSTEVYTYKLASSTVATVTVTYTDSTKTVLTSVVRT